MDGAQLPQYSRFKFLLKKYLFIGLTFGILATSVDVERVFSKGHLVLSHVRNRLTVESSWALLCLGAWSKLGLVSSDDIKTAASLPDAEEGEEDIIDEFDILL